MVAGRPPQPGEVEPSGRRQPAVTARPRGGDARARRTRAASSTAPARCWTRARLAQVERGLAEEAEASRLVAPRGRGRRTASSKRCSAWAIPPSRAPACTSRPRVAERRQELAWPRWRPGSRARCRRASASRRRPEPGSPAVSHGRDSGRYVARLAAAQREHVLRPSLLDPQEGPVPLRVGRQDRVAQLVGERAGRRRGPPPRGRRSRRTPRASRRGAVRWRAPAAGRGRPRARRTRAAPAVPSPEHHPRPAEPVGDPHAQVRVVRGAPGQRGVDVRPLGAGDRQALRLPRRRGRGRRTRRRWRRTRRRGRRAPPRPGRPRGGGRRRRRGCCRAAGSAPTRRRRSSTLTIERATSRLIVSSTERGRDAERGRARARSRPARRRRRSRRAPTARAGRRGTAGRSSTRSRSTGRGCAGAGALVGSASNANRSSSRRAMSRTESDRTRAAASSIASGRPSSDRHTSSTIAVACRRRGRSGAACARARLTNSATECSRVSGSSGIQRTRPRCPAAPGSWRAIRRRGTASSRRSARAPTVSTRCSQLSRSSTVSAPASRSSSDRSPPVTCSVSATTWDRSAVRVDGVQPDQPDATRRRQPAADLDREPGLADARGPDDRHQPVLPDQRRELGDVGLAAHERGGERGQVPGDRERRVRRRRPQHRALPQHLPFECPQSRPRFDAELVAPGASRTREYAASASACRPAR